MDHLHEVRGTCTGNRLMSSSFECMVALYTGLDLLGIAQEHKGENAW